MLNNHATHIPINIYPCTREIMLRTKEHFAYEKLTKPPQFETQKQYSACGFFENGSKWEFSETGIGWRGAEGELVTLSYGYQG